MRDPMDLPRHAVLVSSWMVGISVAPCLAQKDLPLRRVNLGEHWYGAKVSHEELEGKVVLFAYWGASPGCRELVPAVLEASQSLGDRPVHMILTYVEDRPKDQTVAYFARLGLSAECPNITITKDGKHPTVKTKDYLPYYLVFDHRGKLVHHHMGGPYHRGDGNKMIQWLDELSRDVPDFYFGTQPFLKIGALAERIQKRKKLAGAIREAEEMLDPPEGQPRPDPATKAELERLLKVIKRYRDRKLKSVELIFPSQPTKVLPMLAALRREFRGTELGKAVNTEYRKQHGSPRLKRAVEIHKDYARILGKLHKISCCKYCRKAGHKYLRPGCSDCHTPGRKAIVAKEVEKLRRLHEDAKGLTIAKEIEKAILLYTSPIVEVDRRR